jgi:hypothetical protein
MEDDLNKGQILPPIAFPDIPTPDEHAREVRRIFTVCGSVAAAIVLSALATITVCLLRGVPPSAVAVFTMLTMNVAVITFGVGYGIPVGLVSLRRLEIAYRMGYFGLNMNRDAAGAMKKIAERVARETAPLPVKKRPVVESAPG